VIKRKLEEYGKTSSDEEFNEEPVTKSKKDQNNLRCCF
jgi:hypothetical protein